MGKMSLSAGEFVARAAFVSRELTRMKARGPGDTENAMRRLEREYGLSYQILWRLRYRLAQLKDISVGVYARLEAAYVAECERQQAKLTHEIAVAKILGGSLVEPPDAGVGHPPAAPCILKDVGETDGQE